MANNKKTSTERKLIRNVHEMERTLGVKCEDINSVDVIADFIIKYRGDYEKVLFGSAE